MIEVAAFKLTEAEYERLEDHVKRWDYYSNAPLTVILRKVYGATPAKPRPIEVGDTVRLTFWAEGTTGKVIAINDGVAWLRVGTLDGLYNIKALVHA